MEQQIYFDNNATTSLDPQVFSAMQPYLTELYGNPNSAHSIGTATHEGISLSIEQHYKSLHIHEKDTIVFTASATEGINTIHKSFFLDYLKKPSKNQIITTSLEHSAVKNSLAILEEFGIEIVVLPTVDYNITMGSFLEHFHPEKTLLVSIGLVQSETGVILPVKEISTHCQKYHVPVHTDATQGVGKIPIDFQDLGVDYLSFSGHKFHAPKGVGGLIVKHNAPFTPLLHGGNQMGGFRSGTLNVAGIVAMGKALEIADQNHYTQHMLSLRDLLEDFLLTVSDATVHGRSQTRIPNTTFFEIASIDRDYLAWHLDSHCGIAVSTGSACTTQKYGSSKEEDIKGIRISFSRMNTKDEVLLFIKCIKKLLHKP